MRIAILDDYQQAALASADWARLGADELTPFHGHIADTADLVAELRRFDVVVAMRERTPFDSERLRLLPGLRLLVTTGMANTSIDLAAAQGGGGDRVRDPGHPRQPRRADLGADPLACPARARGGRGGSGTAAGSTRWAWGCAAGRWEWWVSVTSASQVAAVGRAFGMEVVAWSQRLTPRAAAAAGVTRGHQGRAVRAVGRRDHPLQAQRALRRAGGGARDRADEADGVPGQHLPRADRRYGCAAGGAALGGYRGRGDSTYMMRNRCRGDIRCGTPRGRY